MLSFLLLVLGESEKIFEKEQIRKLKLTIVNYIVVFKNEQVLLLAYKVLLVLNSMDKYDASALKPLADISKSLEASGKS